MRITYVVDWSGEPNSGVPHKVIDQVTEWKRQDHEVKLMIICPKAHDKAWKLLGGETIAYKNVIGRFLARFLISPVRTLICRSDVVYARYGIFTPLEIIVLCIKSSVLEVNAANDNYYRARSKILFLFYSLQKSVLKLGINLFIYVTQEALSENKNKSAFVTNGINLARFSQKLHSPNEQGITKLVFIGSGDFYWNGAEKLKLFVDAIPNVEITTIGLENLHDPNIKSLPAVYEDELQEFIYNMNGAISTLDIQIMGLSEAAPLKTRHYLASGLPVIAGCRDSAFPTGAEFYFELKFEKNESQISNSEELIAFLQHWRGKRVKHENLSSIDIRNTELTRLNLIQKAIGV